MARVVMDRWLESNQLLRDRSRVLYPLRYIRPSQQHHSTNFLWGERGGAVSPTCHASLNNRQTATGSRPRSRLAVAVASGHKPLQDQNY